MRRQGIGARLRSVAWSGVVVLLAEFVPADPAVSQDLPVEPPVDWNKVAPYRFIPGDELRLDLGYNVLEARRDVVDVTVRSDGRISVPPVGDVMAAGLTPTELDSVVTDVLRSELRAPKVTVSLVKAASNQVYVLGRVEKPGSYGVDGHASVVRAIALAGGFKDDAARNSVLVFHREGPGAVKVARVGVDRLLKSARLDRDVLLSRFDIVYVPRSTIGNVNVFVRQFFTEQGQVLSTMLVGWQLFNLDRVFVVPVQK